MSKTKYSVSRTTSERLQSDRPYLSHHALQRWDERTPSDARSPEFAYDHAADVSQLLDITDEWDADEESLDELRLYAGRTEHGTTYSMLFLVANGVKTVYTPRFVHDSRLRAYLREQAHMQGWTREGEL